MMKIKKNNEEDKKTEEDKKKEEERKKESNKRFIFVVGLILVCAAMAYHQDGWAGVRRIFGSDE